MAYDARFGPNAQTPEQRTQVLVQMQATFPGLKRTSAVAQQLYARYVAGELSWLEVYHALNTSG